MALNVAFQHQSKRVKVAPGTRMSQVLTDARQQFGLSDSLQSHLLHRGKAIDLSIPFRLTGISNNATIELAEIESAAQVQQVRVCIQLPDGKRVQASFNSDTTIECILKVLEVLPLSKERFSLEFLRREIDCDAFPTTTLQELGILSGSAMFRVRVARKTSDSAASSAPSSASSLQNPYVSPTSAASPCSAAPVSERETSDCLSALQSGYHEMKAAVAEEESVSGGSTRTSSYDALQMLRNNSFDAVSRTAVMTLMGIVTNILSDPENEKVRSIRVSNATFERSIGRVKGGIEFMTSIGFKLVPETQALVLSADFLNEGLLEEGLRLLRIEADDLNIPQDTRPALREKKADQSFDVFKPQITRVQMQPRGPSTTEVLVDALKSKQEQLVGHIKPPRSTTIVFRGKRSSSRLDSVLEDSERSDAQLLISSLKARRDKMEKTKNFRTQAMRDLDELKRKRVFQTVLIRVQFPDRTVMQATFHPSETIQDVMDHVTECLADQFRASKFYLYVTPPTQKLVASKTLIELNLVPAALTYFSWVETPPASDVTSAGSHFRSELLPDGHDVSKESVSPLQQAMYPKPLHLDNALTTQACDEPTIQTSSSAQAKPTKKPSWFKP
uniref:UBX domain-containing protein n=1 Tax=Peronospora matthiolae TaxID=2874970 RepID=A0AAV1UIN4_9STRA